MEKGAAPAGYYAYFQILPVLSISLTERRNRDILSRHGEPGSAGLSFFGGGLFFEGALF